MKASFRLHRDPWQRLVLVDADGREHVGVEPIRAFPISDGSHWVFLCDAEGHELACIEDLRELPGELRQPIQEELARRDFLPTLHRIVAISSETEPAEWQVETDRGSTVFVLASEDDVRPLGPDRLLVVDSHGIRYLVPDIRALDSFSHQVLERYV